MLVRIILILGVALMLFAGGAAGWQYWQQNFAAPELAAATGTAVQETPPETLPDAAGAPTAETPAQTWLISLTGELVDTETVTAFLLQDRFVEDRVFRISMRVPMTAFLAEGETLPDPVYRPVFADIRAPRLVAGMCGMLLDAWAGSCRMGEAGVRGESYDPETETVELELRLYYTQKPGEVPLPDLKSHVMQQDWLNVAARLGKQELEGADAMELAAATIRAAAGICAEVEARGQACRILKMSMQWDSPEDFTGQVTWAWMEPMPKGMYPAAPLY
ncbi:hypothetical protein [Pseudogemmobacter humi]|uniref:Uncharacterized protein n=1 Tax=Pseudogemmobacter humi TaxID=2483812 RepID=A0A3P5XMX6_9RHOB|nr:hypothetical protein [Pseudogemmobacter humi]VDC30050.1 hypothetical protein XINFAN_02411 [Pseudogemmobacter humi]